MDVNLSSKALARTKADCLIVAVPEKGAWPESTRQADEALQGALSALSKSGDISGKTGATLLSPVSQQPWSRILVVGTGSDHERCLNSYRKAVIAALNAVKEGPSAKLLVALADTPVPGLDEAGRLSLIGRLIEDQLYRFTGFKSTPPSVRKLKKVSVLASGAGKPLKEALKLGVATGRGMNVCKDLGNTPPNVCHPAWLASQAEKLAKEHEVIKTEVLDEKQMKKLGMNALLAVGQGSARPPRLIIMEYKGGKAGDAPHVLVGKGITFDTGGISIKPGEGMDEMKFDMGGSAAVLGAMQTVAETRPKINVTAVIAAAENMPDGKAYRPGDILTTLSGQTVEVLNTDAEGRLVLCDALTYVERFKPATVVDMATLTGACIMALGRQTTGLFANDDELADQLLRCGERAGDRAWRLPIWDEYQSMLDSNFADMQNIGGRPAGSITAACFLSRFAKGYRWAHLDIAGTAWNSGAEKGSTGRPVPLLIDYLMSHAGR